MSTIAARSYAARLSKYRSSKIAERLLTVTFVLHGGSAREQNKPVLIAFPWHDVWSAGTSNECCNGDELRVPSALNKSMLIVPIHFDARNIL